MPGPRCDETQMFTQSLLMETAYRAGALSTNWNWLGGLALIPLSGMATFALTPPTGLTTPLAAHWPSR